MAKLLIWDLDDTLWSGTLAEGDEPLLHAGRADAIRRLNERGVVNSICSKNDFGTARAHLERLGLWPEFVFPEIAFEPKGALVARIIADMQLRASDVVFIDDNPMNLREVAHANPGIQTMDATGDDVDRFLERLLDKVADVSKSRVPEYRILEQKRSDRRAAPGSNEDFLASCGIKVTLVRRTDNLVHAERIEELINRTNQLNFTRSRVPAGSIAEYVIDVAHNETYSAFVWDRYGYYGLVGFAAIERKAVLRHFLFSCRTMNMGVEYAVASVLKKAFEALDFPVRTEIPSWIRFVQPDDPEFLQKLAAEHSLCQTPARVRVMANCQSGAIAHYMRLDGVVFDNWPRVFKLEDMIANGLPPSTPPVIVYGAFNDYDTRYWSSPPTNATYGAAARKLIGECAALGTELIVVLPPDRFSQEREDQGITQDRFASLNNIWSELQGAHPRLHLIRMGEGDLAMDNVGDPRHYDRTTLMAIAALASAMSTALLGENR